MRPPAATVRFPAENSEIWPSNTHGLSLKYAKNPVSLSRGLKKNQKKSLRVAQRDMSPEIGSMQPLTTSEAYFASAPSSYVLKYTALQE